MQIAMKRGVIFRTVLMDTWYAITSIMEWIDSLGYKFICPLRSNRLILDRWSDPDNPKYRPVKDLPWIQWPLTTRDASQTESLFTTT